MWNVIVTGGAGFIGVHVIQTLVAGGYHVVNVDALTYASDLRLLEPLRSTGRYHFEKLDIRDHDGVERIFRIHAFS